MYKCLGFRVWLAVQSPHELQSNLLEVGVISGIIYRGVLWGARSLDYSSHAKKGCRSTLSLTEARTGIESGVKGNYGWGATM